MELNYWPISKLQRFNRWSLGMYKYLLPTFYDECSYLSMSALNEIHVSNRGQRWDWITTTAIVWILFIFDFPLHSPYDDVIKWKHFLRYWPFVRGSHRSPVNSPHKGQWHGVLMFSLICARTNGWANNRGASDLKRHRVHHDVTVMSKMQRAWCQAVQGERGRGYQKWGWKNFSDFADIFKYILLNGNFWFSYKTHWNILLII